jgi:PAS domain S-box-containing protein
MTVTARIDDEVLRDLVVNAGDAVILADPAGLIQFWNGAAERIFGYTRDAALGQSLDLIIPERLRERHWDGYNHTMASGKTKYGERTLAVPAVRADGTRISIEFTVTLMKDAAGAVTAIAAILRDVTTRFEQDRALRRRVDELERELETLRR